MPEERVELSWGCPRRILSPLRLPFRHSGQVRAAKYTLRPSAAVAREPPRAARLPANARCTRVPLRRSLSRYERLIELAQLKVSAQGRSRLPRTSSQP